MPENIVDIIVVGAPGEPVVAAQIGACWHCGDALYRDQPVKTWPVLSHVACHLFDMRDDA